MEAEVTKLVEAPDVYYTVFWSRLRKADRYEIITKVPSVSGIFELYYQDEHKQLNLFHIAKAWYGGLRTALRKATDPELEEEDGSRQTPNASPRFSRNTTASIAIRSFPPTPT